MPDDKDKSQREVQTFHEFIPRSGLLIDPCSVEKRQPPEPDILCWVNGTGHVAFELTEICNERIARAINELPKQDNSESELIRLDPRNPILRILKEKQENKYETPYPVELLVCGGRTFTPGHLIKSEIERVFSFRFGGFQRVWLMGWPGEACECVIEVPEPSYPT